MIELPMPNDVREALEQRLIDIRNTVVADLKITNAEKVLALNTNKQHPDPPFVNA